MSFFPMNKRKSIFEEILTNNCSNLNAEQLLSEEYLFDDINFHMNSASNFFKTQPDLVLDMLNLAVNENYYSENGNCDENNRNYKLPFIATEVFACEIPGIMELFFDDSIICEKSCGGAQNMSVWEEKKDFFEGFFDSYSENYNENSNKNFGKLLLGKLFSLLEKAEIKEESFMHFHKILYALLHKKGPETIFYIYDNENILENMLIHVSNSKIIAEILTRVILIDCCYNQMKSKLFLDTRKKLLDKIIDKIQRNCTMVQEDTENLIEMLIQIVNDFPKGNSGKELVLYIFSEQNLQKIFELFVICDPQNLKNLALLLQTLLIYEQSDIKSKKISIILEKNHKFSQDSCCEETFSYVLEQFLGVFIEKLFEPSWNESEKFFGLARLELLKCFTYIFKSLNEKIIANLKTSSFFSKLIALFEKYPRNNLLHNVINSILKISLESDFESLFPLLFENTNFLDFLIENLENFDQRSNLQKAQKTFFGYLCEICEVLAKTSENNQDSCLFNNYLKENPCWQAFISINFKKIREILEFSLGGSYPSKNSKENMANICVKNEEPDEFEQLFQENQLCYLNSLENSSNSAEKELGDSEISSFILKYEIQEENHEIEFDDLEFTRLQFE